MSLDVLRYGQEIIDKCGRFFVILACKLVDKVVTRYVVTG